MCLLDSGLVYVSLRGMKTYVESGGVMYQKLTDPLCDEFSFISMERGVKYGDVRSIDGSLYWASYTGILGVTFKREVEWVRVHGPVSPQKKARK